MAKLSDHIKFTLLPFIGYLFIRLLAQTCKKEYNVPKHIYDDVQFIAAFWHGKLLMQPYLYKWVKRGSKIALMISDHKDGEILAKAMGHFGFDTVRGSSRKGAIKALKDSFKKADLGYDIAMTPDGPKGPRGSVADGVVVISQKKEMKIVAFDWLPERYWQLKSWDGFMIPKPFTTIRFFASEPFDLDELELEAAKKVIQERLNEHAVI